MGEQKKFGSMGCFKDVLIQVRIYNASIERENHKDVLGGEVTRPFLNLDRNHPIYQKTQELFNMAADAISVET
ncbi:hypothetical protein CEXT_770571 [Caerostris extrusa]|uniref:Uncharacterized protein n=1 Tax=Caerostris extrusa TaxID=172846 RepID=A0AAV4XKU4_CAEEX|nr:hypothetical protein CEXT_770571 [Caerostris extrusa]